MKKMLATAAIAAIGITGCGGSGHSARSQRWTVEQAEAQAQKALDKLECNRTDPGSAAEAWAEANSTQPHGFEIIAECAGRVPKT